MTNTLATEKIVKLNAVPDVRGIASFIDIYDCDPQTVRSFAQKHFGGSFSRLNVTQRY